jgi:DNA-binding response OmpR family regulator
VGTILSDIVGVKNFCFGSAKAFLSNSYRFEPIAIFLDVHLAEDSCGLDMIPEIKKKWRTSPIIVITSDKDGELISKALSMGADDFITKPLRPEEVTGRLNARVQELVKLSKKSNISFGDISLDTDHLILSGPSGKRDLSPKDSRILAQLMLANGVVVPRSSIKSKAWGKLSVSDNSLNRKIHEVKKFVKEVSLDVQLKSLYGKGVVLTSPSINDQRILLDDLETMMESQQLETRI